MKIFTRLTALLLCLCLIAGMIGCTAEPEPTIAPTAVTTATTAPTEPTEPLASDVYTAAFDASAASPEFLMEVNSYKTITLAEQSFTQSSAQSIHYAGYGTDAMKYRSTETITFGKDYTFTYDEVYIDGVLYASLDHTDRFRSEISAADAALRCLNPAMLDASLYGQITASGDGTILFEDPTAPEDWAMPTDAEFLQASGTATVGTDGKLKSITYTISYLYGPAEITLEVDATLMFGSTTVNTPDETDKYMLLQDVDALYLYMNACGMVSQASSLSTSSIESVMSQAAAVMRNQSTAMNMISSEEDFLAKVETSLYLMDYSTNQEQQMKQEELFIDGKYTVAIDDGEPVEEASVTADAVTSYCGTLAGAYMILPEFWYDAVITDLGSTMLIEMDLTEVFGDTIEASICNTFWGDGNFLRNMASIYEVKETSGYIAVDKYTGLPTSGGYYFEGTHTIEGYEYALTLQSDQSIDGASLAAYYNITDEMPEEPEPEENPTPLFYHVTGENGQEMWLLGTIHVGDERTAYLPQEIYDAFAASDALALEINSKLFEEQMEEDVSLQEQVSASYYFSDGTTLESMMDEESYNLAVKYLKASGNYNMNAPYMKPSLWSQSIDNFFLRQGYALQGNQGVEERLHKWAEDLDMEIREIESSLFQIQMLTGFSDELQLLILEESIAVSAREYWESSWDLYEKWCQGDEEVLRQALSEEVGLSALAEEELAEYESVKHLIEEYNKAMSFDRNVGMLDAAISYLESGEVVFYAVGLAHLLDGTNGLVEALRTAGYTVDLVTYK